METKVNDKTKAAMEAIRLKQNPTREEKLKYLRFYLKNIGTKEKAIGELSSWGKAEILELIKEIELEKKKTMPKRYYVSLKEPLEDEFLR